MAAMPARDEIPDRLPAPEHAVARMRLQPSPLQRQETPGPDADPTAGATSPVWPVAAGLLGGLGVLGVAGILVRALG
jgi:hypothetical protein